MSEENTRGKVGESSAGNRIKARHSAEGKGKSLKVFARLLVQSGDQDAKDWFDSKTGVGNISRLEKNKTRISLEKSAKKMSKKK